MDKPDVVAAVCAALSSGAVATARALARADYPFAPGTHAGRRYTEMESLRVFWRDGFVDRYSGARLVFPGTLRLLSQLLPDEFPAHPNWRMSESHLMYWELFPTVDHVVPLARGGPDSSSNWVCTSMLRNSAKSNWTLAELGWTLVPPGDVRAWDGLTQWFLDYVAREPDRLRSDYLRRWHTAAMRVIASE